MINGEGLIASDRTRYSSSFAARLRGLVEREGQRKVVLRAFRFARARAKSYITPFVARCLRNRIFRLMERYTTMLSRDIFARGITSGQLR